MTTFDSHGDLHKLTNDYFFPRVLCKQSELIQLPVTLLNV